MTEQRVQSRLAECPRLQSDCTVTPTVIRQEHWVIVKNVITGRHIRLHRDLWMQIVQFDGLTSIKQWVERHALSFGDQQLLSVIVQLQRLGILDSQSDSSSSESLSTRFLVRMNPLMLRLRLFNPTNLLDVICKLTSAVRARYIYTVVSAVVIAALYGLIMNWSAVTAHWQDVGGQTQFLYVVFLYPLTKCLHELAHGLLLRGMGGQVPEAGVSFIVLFPMPYVDVTDAWTLHRQQRMLVTAAGMMMDLFIASLGILLWINLSTGIIANIAFTAALMGVVSILLFNANPLLKFDGYYLMEDALDSPGLARRSQAFYRYLFKRYVLVVESSAPPVVARGEKFWLLAYGAAATTYRFFIAAVICVYLVSTLHELGVLLSLFSLIPLCALPIYRFLQFLLGSNELENLRTRAITVSAVLVLFVVAFLLTVPLPSSTRTQGIVWVDQQAEVYAAQTGQLEHILVNNGDVVVAGQPLMVLTSVDLSHELEQKLSAAQLARMDVARHQRNDPHLAASALIQLRQTETEVDNAHRQMEKLVIRSPVDGRVAMGIEKIATGLHVSQGTLLAYVIDADERVVRAVVDQAALGNVEAGVQGVQVRLAPEMTASLPARIARQVPSGSHQLPSAALANTGFDGFDVEQAVAGESARTREKVFHLELVLDGSVSSLQHIPMGTRAFVTLEHADEPLAKRWIRVSRQLLLKHLSV
ncbi:MAG: HlyD family efflux transporter periplasmic adaptor subunit [Granulosicoccus sp.]